MVNLKYEIYHGSQLARDLLGGLTMLSEAYRTPEIKNLVSWLQSTAENKEIISVPHIWQAGQGAKRYRNDCIHSCMAMLIHHFTNQRPSVDKLAEQSGKFNHAFGTVAQGHRLARLYNLQFIHYSQWAQTGPLDKETIINNINDGRAVVCLVLYGRLPVEIRGTGFIGWHSVVITGYQYRLDGSLEIVFNDPYQEAGLGLVCDYKIFDYALVGNGWNIPRQGWAVWK